MIQFKCILFLCSANISQDSKADDGTTLIYADIGAWQNAVNRVQKVVAPDDSKYKVQYAAINYNAKAPQNLCVPNASMTKVIEDELKSGIYIKPYIKLVQCHACSYNILSY